MKIDKKIFDNLYKNECDSCPLKQNNRCKKSIQNNNSIERIKQCYIAKTLIENHVSVGSIWVDLLPVNEEEFVIRHYDESEKVHLLRTKAQVDVVVKDEEKFIPIEVKYIKYDISQYLSKIEINTKNNIVTFLINRFSFETGYMFHDFFKSYDCILNKKVNTAVFYCFSNKDITPLFNYYSLLLSCAYNSTVSFLIFNVKANWTDSKKTAIWYGSTFKTKEISSVNNMVKAKIETSYMQFNHEDVSYHTCDNDEEQRSMNDSFVRISSYIESKKEITFDITIKKCDNNLIVITFSN